MSSPDTHTAAPGPLLGTHVSVTGGMTKGLERAESIGCAAMQVFVKGNTRWQFPPLKDADVAAFRERSATSPVRATIAHSIYLVNLASAKDDLWRKSIDNMADELSRCEALGIPGVVMHPGAHCGTGRETGIERIAAGLDEIHRALPGIAARVLLETTAGQGTCIGAELRDLADIIALVREPARVGVCVDTCHVFAAGYDIRTRGGYDAFWAEFDRLLGRARLRAVHLNDSQKPFNSRRDRHEHIGRGELGPEPFRMLVNDPALRGIPMVLETDKGPDMAEDVENLATLRSYIGPERDAG